jgi:hypothetical protein
MDSLPPVCDSHSYAGTWIHLPLPPLDVEAAVSLVSDSLDLIVLPLVYFNSK